MMIVEQSTSFISRKIRKIILPIMDRGLWVSGETDLRVYEKGGWFYDDKIHVMVWVYLGRVDLDAYDHDLGQRLGQEIESVLGLNVRVSLK